MRNVAIIPARGGSKRIPRKNVRPFLGKPIIAYSIEVAQQSGLFDEIMVSTDDDEIKDVAIRFGATIPFKRSRENADDQASTTDVLMEVLNEYEIRDKVFDYVCCIYPTAPMIQLELLEEGFKKLQEEYEGSLPVVEFEYPVWRGLYLKNDGIRMIWPENKDKRSQDLPRVYHDAGQWYWFKPDVIKKKGHLLSENMAGISVNPLYVQDIDDEVHWKLAEMKYRAFWENSGA